MRRHMHSVMVDIVQWYNGLFDDDVIDVMEVNGRIGIWYSNILIVKG